LKYQFWTFLSLFPEHIYQHRQDDTENYGRGQWEIEGEVLLADKDIPGEAPKPGDIRRHEKKQTDGKEYGAHNEKKFGKITH